MILIHNYIILVLVITKQQPSNSCVGLQNFISTPALEQTCNVMETNNSYSSSCEVVMCSTANWSLEVVLQPCNNQGIINVTEKTNMTGKIYGSSRLLNFSSNFLVQQLSHSLGSYTGNITLNSRVELSNQTHYYLISLEAPLLNISFPMTAIPVECHMLPGKQEVMIL